MKGGKSQANNRCPPGKRRFRSAGMVQFGGGKQLFPSLLAGSASCHNCFPPHLQAGPGVSLFPSPLAGSASCHNFFPPHWWGRVRVGGNKGGSTPPCSGLPEGQVSGKSSPPHWWGRVRVGGKAGKPSCFPDWQTVFQPAVPGRPIPLSFGKELGCGTRGRIGQGSIGLKWTETTDRFE
jgi:hypothetical protein